MHDHASLNRAYRVVFNAALGAMVAVPETARSHRGGTSRGIAASAGLVLALAGSGAWAQTVAPNALPQDGKVAAGQVTINDPRNNHLRIEQASDRAIVDWKSFDIGKDASVEFAQRSAAAVILNRVASGPGSQILGALAANGQVYLVNGAGILFGKDAQVNVGGITASTLDIRNDDFLAGRDRFFSSGGTGSVVNEGTIRVARGGRVALVGTRVENAGRIFAPGGQVVLAAGQQATLAIGANGHLQVEVDAAQVGALVANGGLVQADGGQVILTARGAGALASAVVSNTGTLQARTVDGASGRILLLADMANGRVEAGGTLDASAPGGGDGGFIDTSAARVKIAPDLKVTTAAPRGRTGKWLIDPQDYTIAAAGGDMTGTQLSSLLGGTDIEIQSSGGGGAGNGDIHVNDAVTWNANTLTLTAARDININAVMTAAGTSSLVMNTATANGGDAAVAGGGVKVGMNDAGFIGRVDFPGRSGAGFLTINGVGYTVLNALGAEGSTSGTDLQGMNGNLAGHYALGSDIDASATGTWNGGEGFAPVGPNGTAFTGNFEGLGHVVRGLTINRPDQQHIALFSVTTGRTSNVGLAGASVAGNSQTGALVGYNFGEVANSYANGSVVGGLFAMYLGGLVGRNDGSVTHSQAAVTVGGPVNRYFVGGLVGGNHGTVSDSHASGTVEGTNAVGGLVGINHGSVTRSYATVEVATHNHTAGGLVGENMAAGTIEDSFATGSVDVGSWYSSGGLVGSNSGTIRRSHATGAVRGQGDIGGLVGTNRADGLVEESYASGTVTGGGSGVGGLVGVNGGTGFARIHRSYATGSVTGSSAVGGLVGYNYSDGTILTSYSTGAVVGDTTAGGLLGQDGGGTVANSYWNIDTSGQASSARGTGLTSAQMQLASSFVGFNFTTTPGATGNNWVMVDVDGTLNNAGGAAGATRPMLASEYATTIRNGHQLQLMAMDLDASYRLGRSFDASSSGTGNDVWSAGSFVPVGSSATPFTGSLDGANRTITGLAVNPAPGLDDRVGLFGVIGASGSVSHLGLVNASVSGDSFVGAIAGENLGAIRNSYVVATIAGNDHVGGMAGANSGSIASSYAAGTVTGAGSQVGGFVGANDAAGSIGESYSTADVAGSAAFVGGFAGENSGSIAASFWNTATSNQAASAGGTGITTAQMQELDTFAVAGWDISASGGAGTWRIYEGHTAPLLRSFLTPLAAITGYDGSATPTANVGAYSLPVGTDMGKVFGTATTTPQLTLASSGTAGNYHANVQVAGLWSDQAGYDIHSTATRVIATPGSAAGDVRLDNPLTWGSGTINVTAANNVDLNGQPLSSANGTLAFDAGNQIVNAGGVAVRVFDLQGGTWNQVGALPSFSPLDFRISGGTFIRALAGDGVATPYEIADVHGLQGAGSDGMDDKRFVLANDIDAFATAGWNGGDGFAPMFLSTGVFDGLGRTINGLVINRPGEDAVGLFSVNAGTVRNLGLVGGSVTGFQEVGAVAGVNGGTISNVHSSASVIGEAGAGGLVGASAGRIEDSRASGAVTASDVAGGLVGYNDGDIDGSHATGAVTATGLNAGGLAGINDVAGVITRSHATGAVQADTSAGGLVGDNFGAISLSYATGSVTGTTDVGGLVAYNCCGAITQSYATGAVSGVTNVGGLVGYHSGTIANSYAVGPVSGTDAVGGLVGYADIPPPSLVSISSSYSGATSVTGSTNVGGLVGVRSDPGMAVENSFWAAHAGVPAASDGGVMKTPAEMMQLATFAGASWDVSAVGGTGNVWRIYEGHTAPLLRNLLTPLALTPVYDGSNTTWADIGAYTVQPGADMARIFGTAAPSGPLTISSSGTAGNYRASVPVDGLYSDQLGYDLLPATRTIATPGSAAGNVRLDNAITWSSGTLHITATNDVDLAAQTLSGDVLTFAAGNRILNAAGVTVNVFDLQGGTWSQVGTLPTFNPTDFRISGGTFIRALGGDGTGTPYQLTDVYGLQGVGSSGMGDKSYVLANDIDAAPTASWNAGAGFAPMVLDAGGSLDGQGHTIEGLRIERPGQDGVGLFSLNQGTVANVGVVGGQVTGRNDVGALAAWSGGLLENVYSTATVNGGHWVGGLVGTNAGQILDSHATGDVEGSGGQVGGLAGSNYADIARSYATGNATAGHSHAGGLVGENEGTIQDSYATGDALAQVYGAGGLVGRHLAGSIARSYATGRAEAVNERSGGLVGHHFGAISDSYATGAATGGDFVGGLVGYAGDGSSVANSYATGAVTLTGGSSSGGLVGARQSAAATVTGSYWDTTTTGQLASAAGTGVDTATMRQLATFAGWDISATGGTGNVWRIYEGLTAPLLRGFLTPLAPVAAFDGSNTAWTDIGAYTLPVGADMSRIFGTPAATQQLTLSSTGAAGNYLATVAVDGLYSNQSGYDILPGMRVIATPGSAAGDVRLDNPLAWTSGTVHITAANNVDLNHQFLFAPSGTLAFNAGNQVLNAAGVTVNVFDLQGGTWNQVAGTLPNFTATDFRITGGTFVRALGGDGTGTPYQLTDVYGLQGMGSAGMGDKQYVLANDIAAASTAGWNGGAGFAPVADFDGSLDGQGHAVNDLFIERTGAQRVGLFSVLDGSVSNLQIAGGDVTGQAFVGALAGVSNGAITNVSSSASVHALAGAGGLVGQANAGSITGSHATGTVDAFAVAGGLVGDNNAAIVDSDASGAVTSQAFVAGGLAGRNGPLGTITRGHATGAVNALGDRAGGLVGENEGAITGSYATGAVQAVREAGGLVGLHRGAISNSYASGAVSGVGAGSQNVGGLVGSAADGSSIVNAYASAAVTGGTAVGGLVGARGSTATVTASYWDAGTAGPASPADGMDRTTAQMQSQATFAGWDFATTWVLYEGHTRPLLRSFLTPITVTANDAAKTYDGQAYDGVAGVRYSFAPDMGLLLGTPSYTSGVNAGTHAITPGGLYSHQQGYAITFVPGTLTVDPKALTLTGMAAVDKTYDGDATAQLAGGTLVGLVGTETLGFSGHTGVFTGGKNVGNDKAVAVSGLVLADGTGLAGNYIVTAPTGLTADITPRTLLVTAAGVDRTYDGTRGATVSLSDNRLGADVLVLSHDPVQFADRNVGNDKPLGVTGIGIVGGADAGNYVLAATSTATSADITPRPLNVTASASNKVYNGNRNATVSFFSPDWIPGDDLAYTGSGLFADKNAGNGKTVAISGFGLLGADAGNYQLVAVPTTATANILRRNIGVFFVGGDKEYDRTTAADVFLAGDTRIAGDDLTVQYGPASFADWNAGFGKTVTITGVALTGPDAGNYDLASSSVTHIASIFPRSLVVSATATGKEYDGNTSATVSLADNRIAGDQLTIASAPATFADRHAGDDKAVSVTGITMGGADAGNYELASDRANASADITRRPLHVTATGGTKVYDRTDTAGVTLADDRLVIDSFSVVGTARYDNRNAGTGKPVAVTDIRIFGADAGNYELANDATATTGTITPRDVSVAALAGNRTYDGSTDATVGFQIAGVLPLDVLAVAGHDPVAFADRHAGIDKPLQVTGIALGGADAGNYNLTNTAASTTASILPLTINVTAAAADKVYDGTRAADATFFHFRVAGDVFDVLGTATFADKNAGTDKVVSVSDLRLDGAHAGNYRLSAVPVATLADITPRTLNVTATGVDKVYDRSTAASVTFADDRLAGDQLSVSATARFGDFNVGNSKIVSVMGAALTGADAGNYSVAVNATTTAAITPAPLLVAVASETRRAGEPFSGAGTIRYVGLLPGDDASVLFGLPVWGGSAQGATLPGSYSLSVSGFGAANYDIRYAEGTLTLLPSVTAVTSGEAERLARQNVEPPATRPAPAGLRLTIAPDFVRVD